MGRRGRGGMRGGRGGEDGLDTWRGVLICCMCVWKGPERGRERLNYFPPTRAGGHCNFGKFKNRSNPQGLTTPSNAVRQGHILMYIVACAPISMRKDFASSSSIDLAPGTNDYQQTRLPFLISRECPMVMLIE